jgi:hypothetical protein
MPKPHPFSQLTKPQAMELIAVKESDFAAAQINRLFYDGDHWQEASGWTGPIPAKSDKAYLTVKEEIRKLFCSRNVIKETVDHQVDGALAKQLSKRVVLRRAVTEENPVTPDEQKLLDELNALALDYWDKRTLRRLLKEAYGRKLLDERSVARVYVPRGRLDEVETENGIVLQVPKELTLADYLDLIHPEICEPGSAGVETDEATKLSGGIAVQKIGSAEIVEIVFVENGQTIIRTLRDVSSQDIQIVRDVAAQAARDADGQSYELDLGGRLTVYEPGLRTIISQQVRENQMAYNLARTMENKNVVMGGFLERVILDAMPPGQWVQDPEFPNDTTKKIYKVGDFRLGAGEASFFFAAQYVDDATGEKKFGNPRVYWKDPVAPDTFITAARDAYQTILEEVGQAHILISGDATASGKSREQAERTYRRSLEDDAAEIENLAEWLLETPLAMAMAFAGRQKEFEAVRVECHCFIETGTREAAQRAEDRARVAAGFMSLEEAMRLDGTEDPAAEMERIQREQWLLMTPQVRFGLIETLTRAGASIGAAARVAGLEEAQAVLLERSDFAPAPNDNPNNPPAVN